MAVRDILKKIRNNGKLVDSKKVLEKSLNQAQRIDGDGSYKNLAKAQALAHIGSWEMHVAQGKNYWSEETCRIFGITPEQFDGTYEGFLKFVHPDDRETIKGVLKNPPKVQPFDMEFRIVRPDGSVRNVYQLMEIAYDKGENPAYLYGTIQDITEKRQLQKKLYHAQETAHKTQRRFQTLIQDSSDVFEILSPDGTIEYISPAVKIVSGYSPEEMTGKKIFEFIEEKEKLDLIKWLELVLSHTGEKFSGEFQTKTREGKRIFLEVTMSNQLSEPSIQGIVLNWRDITERVEMEKHIEYIATHDELTGLPNGAYLKDEIKSRCQHAEEKQTSFAVMLLDIDGFKYINDAFDYGLGDELIVKVSRRIKDFLNGTSFICRFSGDQFVIIADGLGTLKECDDFARDIIGLFSSPFKVGMYELYVTLGIGISTCPDDGRDYDSLIKHANIALFRTKEEGRNRHSFYSAAMDINSFKQLMLRNDLHKAIERDEVRVYYQPQINLKTNEVLGAEALIRWEHPTWGLVSPDEFITLAEESGFIVNLGHWMLREVCRTYKKWIDDGLPNIKISINYSSIQFYENNIIEKIKSIIDEFELNPDFLVIEITESILIKNSDMIISHIRDLQSLGIQVAIDDFGTGVSSLGYLNTFNIDVLKIDRSFIKNVPSDETSSIITRSVIGMARDLRIKLVAEGIENWDQLSYLKGLNCYTGQGYLYSKPVPGEAFEILLAKRKCKPVRANDSKAISEQRRNFFRVNFNQLLEADMTIVKIGGKKTDVGNTKVLIQNMGPGGLGLISNIRLPIKRDIILQFTTELMGKEIRTCGCPVWMEEVPGDLYGYGIEFIIDENERMPLTGILNQVQIKMRKNPGFADGRFVPDSILSYFKARI